MKPRSLNLFFVISSLAPLALTGLTLAASVTYDADTATTAAQDGAGTGWNISNSNFWNGTSDLAWPNTTSDEAVFGAGSGAADVVTVGSVNANKITFNAPGSGNYTLSGGTITLGGTTPTIAANADASIGSVLAGTAGLTKTGTGTLTLSGSSAYTGATSVSNGMLTFGSGGSTGGGTLALGTASGSRAVLNMNSTGTVTHNTTVNVGGAGASANGAGAINQSSGTVNLMNNTGYLQLGNGGYGSYQLSGGTLNLTSASGIRIGDTTGGLGSFVQTGGNLNVNRYFVVAGNQGTAPVGVATITGGTITGATGQWYILGNGGTATGTLNVGTAAGGAGTIVSRNGNGITLGDTGTPTGILNVNSGTIQFNAGLIRKAAGSTGIVNLNGGTLKANGANLTLIDTSPTAVRVFNGGLKLDTQTNNATISANLLTATGNGIYPAGGVIAQPSATGAGYIGAPLVTVTTTGTGTGATAIANVVDGQVTGITMTCPGQGYAVDDTVTFAYAGGGSTTAASSFVYTLTGSDLAANGVGGLTKLGSGKLTLSGANTYSGGSVLEAGMVALGSAGALGSTGVISMNGGTLQFSASNTTDYSSRLRLEDYVVAGIDTNGVDVTFASAFQLGGSGNGGINKLGAGILTLAGSHGYTGDTTVTAGTLRLDYSGSNASKLADGSVLKIAGGSVDLAGGSHVELVGGTEITGSGAVTITRSSGGAVLDLGYIGRSGAGTGTLDIAAAGIARTATPNDGSGKLPAWVTVGGLPASNDGSGNIVAYSAFTDVNRLGGKVSNNALANVRIVNGGTSGDITPLASGLSDISTLLQNATAGPATITLGGSDTLRLGMDGAIVVPAASGALTIQQGALTAGGSDDSFGDIAVDADGSATIASTISNNGSGQVLLSKAGSGSLALTASNSYSGGTLLTGGQLRVNHAQALGTGPINISGGSLDNTSGAPIEISDSLAQTWDGNFSFGGTNDLSFAAGNVTVTGHRAVAVNAGTLSIAGTVTGGAYDLAKSGAGTLFLGTCGLTGTTTVTGGTLEVQARANGDIPYVVNQGATLRHGYTNGAGYANTNLKLNGSGVAATTGLSLEGGTTFNVSGTMELLTAPTTIRQFGTGLAGIGIYDINSTGLSVSAVASGSVIDSNIEFISRGFGMATDVASGANTATGDLVMNGRLNVPSLGLHKRGAGSLVLNAAATTNNLGVRILAGSVITGVDNALGENAVLPISSGAKLVMNGHSQAAATLSGAGQVLNGSATPAVLTIKQGADQTFSGVLGGAGANDANISLVKNGTNKLTLSGANTYSGSTTVNAGTLAVTTAFLADGSDVLLTGTGALELTSAATDVIDQLFVDGVAQSPGIYGAVGSGAQFERSYITGTGKLSVTTGGGADFNTWAASKGLDGTAGKVNGLADDPEHDGVTNLVEFYLNGNPLASDPSILPASSLDATYLIFTFNRRDDAEADVTLQSFQYGSTLAGWSGVAIGAADSGPDGNGVIVMVSENSSNPDLITVKIPKALAAGGKLFGRLQVVK